MAKTSQYRGVRAERNKWRADITSQGKKKFLGYFDSEIAAAEAYNSALIRMGLDKRKPNVFTSQPPKLVYGRTIQTFSPKSIMFKSMGLNTASVQVEHDRQLELKDAIKLAINDHIIASKPFSAYNITEMVRESISQGKYVLFDTKFYYDNGWKQSVIHDEVKEIVHQLHSENHFVCSKDTNQKYILYVP